METALVMIAVTLGVVAVAVRRAAQGRRLPVAEGDEAELAALAKALVREHHALTAPVLLTRITMLRARKVPVARAESSGMRGQWILCFADGTGLIVRGRRSTDGTLIALTAPQHHILLDSFEDREDGVAIKLAWAQRSLVLDAVAVAEEC